MTEETPLEFANINIEENPQPQITPAPEAPEAPKKKRGRPKKTESTPDPEIKREDPSSLFDQIKKEVEQNEQYLNNQNSTSGAPLQSPIHEAASKVVDGYMLLTICDTFFPMIIKMFFSDFSRFFIFSVLLGKPSSNNLFRIFSEFFFMNMPSTQ